MSGALTYLRDLRDTESQVQEANVHARRSWPRRRAQRLLASVRGKQIGAHGRIHS